MERHIEIENEIWKDIADYYGYYQVSNYGRVKRTYYHYIDKYGNKKLELKKYYHK